MDEQEAIKITRVLDEIDTCIKLCYCHRFSKIRGIDGVIIVRPHDVKYNPADIVYNIIVLSENMNGSERQIAFMEQLINEYILFKNTFEDTNIKSDIHVIYTPTSNLKNVMHPDDAKVEAYISSKKYGTSHSNEIIRGSYGVFVGADTVYCAQFERPAKSTNE